MTNNVGMEQLTEEVVAIKRLLMFALIQNGVSQGSLAAALGVSQSSVSRIFGGGGVTKRAPSTRGRKPNAEAVDA